MPNRLWRLSTQTWSLLTLTSIIITKLWGLWLGGWLTLIWLLLSSYLVSGWLAHLAGSKQWHWQNWVLVLGYGLVWLPFGLLGLTSSLQAGIVLSAPFQNQLFASRYVWLPILGVLWLILICLSGKWLPATRQAFKQWHDWPSYWRQGWQTRFWRTWGHLLWATVRVIVPWLGLSLGLVLIQWLVEILAPNLRQFSGWVLLTGLIFWSWWQLQTWLVRLTASDRVKAMSSSITILTIGLAAVLAFGWLVPFQPQQPAVIAHRGVDANDGVQNTTKALRRTVRRVRPKYVEIDVQQTADRHFVVLHDETLWHLAHKPIKVGQHPVKQLAGLPLREHGHVASLSRFSAYQQVASGLQQPLIVEIKVAKTDTADMVPIFAGKYATKLEKSHSFVHSLDYRVISQLKQAAPTVKAGYITPFNLVALADNQANFYSLQSITLSKEQILAAHRQGKPVYVWTVDQPWSIVHCWSIGADGLITDRASVVKMLVSNSKHFGSFQLLSWLSQLF